MTNSFVDKIKSGINFALVLKFDTAAMNRGKYIPVCMYKGAVCVIASSETDQKKAKEEISKLTDDTKIAFKVVPDNDFNELFSYVKENIFMETGAEEQELEPESIGIL